MNLSDVSVISIMCGIIISIIATTLKHFSTTCIPGMINSGGRLMKESVDPPRGRMLRGKSVIETSDYNQPFSGLQRGAGGNNFSTSAFQPPQQLYNQQLQQQLLLQKAGLLGTGFQHGRSASHVCFNVCLYQFVYIVS